MNAQDVLNGFLRKGFQFSFHYRFWGAKKVGIWKHFTENEVKGLDVGLVGLLDQARDRAGVPFIITCGLRTPSQNNLLAESVKDSAHLTGNAVDLACADSQTRFLMIKALLDVGFTRIGVYSAHLHADNSRDLPQNVFWYVHGT